MKAWHDMPFGACCRPGGGASFRLWAPAARAVELLLTAPGGGDARVLPMAAAAGGWHALALPQARAGERYAFRIHRHGDAPGAAPLQVGDPAARAQPGGIDGPSLLVDPCAFDWGAAEAAWAGRPLHEAVFYELHVGAFTPEGTYAAAAARLPYLRELGITAVQLMPLAEYGGERGWGYDGVLPFAPKAVHGGPDDLKALVRAAHALGLMVFLDVVYNHFGPGGNPLGQVAPGFFTDRRRTPWGPAIALEGEAARPVRDFFIHNALYWLQEFRIDGLRLDAVDAIQDDSPQHLVAELADAVRCRFGAGPVPRQVHLVMENARNPASWLDPAQGPCVHAQWNDDFHHAMHVLLTGEAEGYYAGFAHHPRFTPVELVARTLAEGYAYQGETYPPWQRPRGEPSAHLPPACFVHFLQNHDHVGNRAHGERLTVLAAPAALRAATAVLLLSPSPPLLFMGEEWGAATPFQYFCDHRGALAAAVREGRRAEFAQFAPFRDPAQRERIPDPCDPATFAASRLCWDELAQPAHQATLAWVRGLLQLRRRAVVPRIPAIVAGAASWRCRDAHAIEVRWPLASSGDAADGPGGAALLLRANLGPRPVEAAAVAGTLLFHLAAADAAAPGADALAAWDVQLWLAAADVAPTTFASESAPESALAPAPHDPPLATAAVPRATYRLQLHAGFGFAAAQRLLPRLQALGVSHLYLSPVMRARPGSTHGYDIVDHAAVNPELGSEAEFAALCDAAHAAGLGLLLDIVPNHMGVLGADNAWWLDVLRHGPAARHAGFFDIDWEPADAALRGRVLLPVLGDAYGRVLEAGELRLAFDAEAADFDVRYPGHRFPLDPRTWPMVLPADLPPGVPPGVATAWSEVRAGLAALPERDASPPPPPQPPDRSARAEALQARLAALLARAPALRAAVAAQVARLNGRPGQPGSFDALDALIGAQAWRPASWRVAGDDINYRRFFNVNELAGLRMESQAVFEATHRRLLAWLAEGRVDGVRIDHPDGLLDPLGYLRRLQRRHAEVQRAAGQVQRRHGVAVPGASPLPRALYVVVEKILAEHEHLPAQWPVHGTTGYDFGAAVTGVLVARRGQARLERAYRSFTGAAAPFAQVLREAKQLTLQRTLAAELNLVTEALLRIARGHRATRDLTRSRLRSALAELVVGFPVYRTYLDDAPLRPQDRQVIEWALANARRHGRAEDAEALAFIAALLLDEGAPPGIDAALRRRVVGRLQQLTAPAMAKSMEDTAFYRHVPLLALNEVGAEPAHFGRTVAAFHAANRQRARTLPHGLLATSTHDTKRSEDVRARLAVLAELPARWRLALQRWRRLNQRRKTPVDGCLSPSAHDEYVLYQTLLGLWPAEVVDAAALPVLRERVQGVMQKSVREAQWHGSWTSPDAAYEAALAGFVEALLAPGPNPFLNELQALVQALAPFGCCNGLAMALLKLTCPGVPDFYQGSEDWHHALVDPDNRRPVDHAAIAARWRELPPAGAGDDAAALAAWLRAQWRRADGGGLKLHLVRQLLAWRGRHPALLRDGAYQPLRVAGPAARHLIAFARVDAEGLLVVLAPRCPATLCGGAPERLGDPALWQDTRLEWPQALRRRWQRQDAPATELLSLARWHPADAPATPLAELLPQQPLAAWAWP